MRVSSFGKVASFLLEGCLRLYRRGGIIQKTLTITHFEAGRTCDPNTGGTPMTQPCVLDTRTEHPGVFEDFEMHCNMGPQGTISGSASDVLARLRGAAMSTVTTPRIIVLRPIDGQGRTLTLVSYKPTKDQIEELGLSGGALLGSGGRIGALGVARSDSGLGSALVVCNIGRLPGSVPGVCSGFSIKPVAGVRELSDVEVVDLTAGSGGGLDVATNDPGGGARLRAGPDLRDLQYVPAAG